MIEKDKSILNNHKIMSIIYIVPLIICLIPIIFQNYLLSFYDNFYFLLDYFKNTKALISHAEIYNLDNFAKVEMFTSFIAFFVTFVITFYIVGKTYLCSLSILKCSNNIYINNLIKEHKVLHKDYKALFFYLFASILCIDIVFGNFVEFNPNEMILVIHGMMNNKIGIFIHSYLFSSAFSFIFAFTIIELLAQIRKFFLMKVVSSFIIYTGILFLTVFFGGRGLFLFWEISIPDIYGDTIPITNTNILVNLIVGIILLVFLLYIKKKLKFSK